MLRLTVALGMLVALSCSNSSDCGFNLDRALQERVGTELDLHELTSFEWDEVRLYGEYSPSERVREETGLEYHPARFLPQDIHVPEGHAYVAFLRNGQGICGEHYSLYHACLHASTEGPAPRFEVASECVRPE